MVGKARENRKKPGTTSCRSAEGTAASSRQRAFILILVMVVLSMASLAALNFSRSMLISHSTSRFSNARLQARMCAESGAQSVRLFLAYPPANRVELGGTWDNPPMFQALNVIPNTDPARRGNFSIISPSLDQYGSFTQLRYGLQNESAKLNLNTLLQLDTIASSGGVSSEALGVDSTDPTGAAMSGLASELTNDVSSTMAVDILMALPGMTEDVALAILDYLDEDDEPRTGSAGVGAEFADYYQNLQTPYKPANGPINSIEQLLLVRGVTPQMLFGYDENRNGVLDQAEMTKMNTGVQPGAMPGTIQPTVSDPETGMPPPLGWAAYLTLHSAEKNMSSEGLERININGEDLETLYADLVEVLGNEDLASFIVAYRIAGTPGGDGTSPIVKLASMAAAESDPDGVLGAQLDTLAQATQDDGPDLSNAEMWSADALGAFDLSQGGSVQFNQVLDLFDASVSVPGQGGGNGQVFLSPFLSDPGAMALVTPLVMDNLTTVDAASIPGRINIMECPQEILRGIPGITDEVADQILEARVDGSEAETRNYEVWLAIEGYLTMDEMRALLPLVTCGGDVFKAQVIGYMEGDAAYSRVEVIVNAAGDLPQIQFFRRLDHLGRGFDISTLGQRFDATIQGGVAGVQNAAGAAAN